MDAAGNFVKKGLKSKITGQFKDFARNPDEGLQRLLKSEKKGHKGKKSELQGHHNRGGHPTVHYNNQPYHEFEPVPGQHLPYGAPDNQQYYEYNEYDQHRAMPVREETIKPVHHVHSSRKQEHKSRHEMEATRHGHQSRHEMEANRHDHESRHKKSHEKVRPSNSHPVILSQPSPNYRNVTVYHNFQEEQPSTYLCLSLFTCFCMNFFFGCPAVWYSCKSKKSYQRGDYLLAKEQGNKAWFINLIGIAVTTVIIVMTFLIK